MCLNTTFFAQKYSGRCVFCLTCTLMHRNFLSRAPVYISGYRRFPLAWCSWVTFTARWVIEVTTCSYLYALTVNGETHKYNPTLLKIQKFKYIPCITTLKVYKWEQAIACHRFLWTAWLTDIYKLSTYSNNMFSFIHWTVREIYICYRYVYLSLIRKLYH